MRKLSIYCLSLVFVIIGCASDKSETETSIPEGTNKIEVQEFMNGGGYTFIRGSKNENDLWIAIREMPVEVGDIYFYNSAMEMTNFESKSLKKTFAKILFVDKVSKSPDTTKIISDHSSMPGMMSSSKGHSKPKVESTTDINITQLSDGYSVETIYNDRLSLAGKTVKVKGVVTKYNGGIMNRNWLHIQDGTGTDQSGDLTITSDQSAKVGDTIVIEGTVAVDKDFGAGYFYEVIIENAIITVEKAI